MPKASVNFSIERGEQLRALAAARGETIAQTIERLISDAASAGSTPVRLPGYAAFPVSGSIVIGTPKLMLPALHPEHARALADIIAGLADGSARGGKRITPVGWSTGISVARVGRGITVGFGDGRVSMSDTTARDLAGLIRIAVATAEK